MKIQVRALAGTDDAFIAWRAPFIANCRGFALKRSINRKSGSAASPNSSGVELNNFTVETVASWVGFADGPHVDPGTRKPTTEWPIQKYLWSDFAVEAGDIVAYQVTPMVGTWQHLVEDPQYASDWTDKITIGSQSEHGMSCFFNRGIVASQWLSRQLPHLADPKKDKTAKGNQLMKSIAEPGNEIRDYLGGDLRKALVSLLDETKAAGGHIYAALFELDDPELLPQLKTFKKHAHIVLGNGSVKKKGEDENSEARGELADICDLHDRFSAPRALAHNKFLVICGSDHAPQAVWTGSTNWTKTGLCTQANNAILIRNPKLAADYLDQWNRLAKAGDATPESLRASNDSPRSLNSGKTTLWFTPMADQKDLEQAGELIAAAREGIIFAMFNPGPRGTLLNDIIELASPSSDKFNPDLYIQGVVNQNPGTEKNPVVLFNRGDRIDANADVVLPAAIDHRFGYWIEELEKAPRAHAMVHSKVVIIDPFGEKPVVMTGSHNMGPKASGTNDENFLIIEGAPELASRYATKIMEIYNQYRWRASQEKGDDGHKWLGLADDDAWQIGKPGASAKTQLYDKRRLRELDFWFGETS
jgi:phosphatidylserine/phosphatidylglycerophosphate/cardiolipin synthase-like enzyme